MHKHSSDLLLGFLLLTSCSSCSAADLTRPQAKIILSKTKVFTSAFANLDFLDYIPGAFPCSGFQEFVAEGELHNPEFAKLVAKADPYAKTLTLLQPVRSQVDQITGIADAGQGRKEVTFNWSMANVPDVLKPVVVGGGTGRAILRLYDDGWRVENGPELANNVSAPILTSAQQSRVAMFKEAVRTRQQDQERDLQLWREKLAASTKPTKVLYSVKAQPAFARTDWSAWDVVDVTDAGVTVTGDVSDSKPGSNPHSTPWLCVGSIRVEDAPNRVGQLERSRINLSGWLGPNAFSARYPSIRITEIMKGTGCGPFGPHIGLTNPAQAQQVYEEMQKAYQAWMATYKPIIPVAR